MKKLKSIFLASIVALGMSSCTVYFTHTPTGNPVGKKVGVAKGHALQKDLDYSLQTAAKNGKIDKIGSVDTKVTVFIIPFYKTTVTGE